MLPSTSPKAILFLPTLVRPAVASESVSDRPGRTSDDWVEVDGPGKPHHGGVDSDLRKKLRRPEFEQHVTLPLCEDPGRLGDRNLARMHKIQLDVFSKLAQAVTERASGARIRRYFEQAERGVPPALAQSTGLTEEELKHFRDYFGRLPDYFRGQSLNRPELGLVAAHLLGGSSVPEPNADWPTGTKEVLLSTATARLGLGGADAGLPVDKLPLLGRRQWDRLERGLESVRRASALAKGDMGAAGRQALKARAKEMRCYLDLVKAITLGLTDPTVQMLLAPPAPLRGQLHAVGQWVTGYASSGAGKFGSAVMQKLQPDQATPKSEHT